MLGVAEKTDLEGTGSIFGMPPQNMPAYPKETRMRMFSGCLDDPYDKRIAEDLLTKSLHGGGYLNKPGDVVVLSHEGTFDKQGAYHFYLYYMELPADEKCEDGDGKKNN